MELELEHAAGEIKRLQRCINNLISVLALAAIWSEREPSQIIHGLLDALLRILRLDLVYIRLKEPVGYTPREMARVSESEAQKVDPSEVCEILNNWFGDDPQTWSAAVRKSIGEQDISLLPLRLGLQGELGLIVAGSQRVDFPSETEKLVLSIAANQGAIGLQEARLRGKMKSLASELDDRVAQRTRELREANAQVARSEERWRSVFENSAVGVALTDVSGRFIATNPVYQEMLGYTGEELQKLSFLDITLEAYRERNRMLVGELLEGKRQQFQIEKQYRRKDGKSVWVRNNVSLVPGTEHVPRFLMALSEDITERKQAEEALRNSEQSFRLMVDGIAGLVAIMTATGELETVNRQVLEYFGKTTEELNFWPAMDVVHPEDLHRAIAAWNHSVETATPYDVDHRLRRADGMYRWFHARGVPLRDGGGRALRWYVLLTDIHERKEAEEKVRQSEGDMQEAQRLAHIGSWKLDVRSGKVTVSPEIYRIYDAKPEEGVSNPDFWFDRIHPEDQWRVRERFETCIAQKLNYEADYRIVLPDGTIRYQHSIGHPILSASGTLLEFLGTAMDVTEQVQARIALQKAFDEIEKSKDQLRAIINTIPTTAWSTRPDGYCDFLNERWLDYAGLTAEQAQGWGWGGVIHSDDLKGLVEHWDACLASGKPAEAEVRMRRFDGGYRWFLFRANPLRDESGRIVKWYGTTVDIDDRKQAEMALHAAMDERTRLAAFREEIGMALSRQEDLKGILQRCASAVVRHVDAAFARIWTLGSDGTELELQASAGMYTRLDGSYRRIPVGQLKIGLIAQERKPHFTNDVQNDPRVSDRDWARREKMLSFAGYPLVLEDRVVGVMGMFSQKPLTESTLDALSFAAGIIAQGIERKRGEEALRASERNLTLNINAMPTLLASARPDGWGDFFNQRWIEYTGLSAEQLEGWGWAAALHPDDTEGLLPIWRSSLASGVPLEAEARMRRFDGVYRWLLFRANALRDKSGEIVKWYGNAVDIEDRKKAEERLRRSEAFLAEAQRRSLTGSFSWQVAAGKITWSEQLYRIYGVDPAATVTVELVRSRFHPEDIPSLSELLERVQSSGEDFEYGHRLIMPDRSIKYLQVVGHSSRDSSGQLEYIGTAQDVTQRRLAEEVVAKARTELANIARATSLGVLTASIAHEVNQPLFGIITNATTCLSMLSSDPPDVQGARETARRTIRDGNRASDVITRLRTLYSKKEPAPESMDLNDATREVISLSLSELQRQRVIMRQELADDLPFLKADRVQIQQVIMNLVRNASDAMSNVYDRPRELLIKTERDEDDRVRLSVKDAGVGFEPQAADRLFEAFYTTKKEGMGIGLSISRSIIEAHQGRLWAIANDGPGATFLFSIPCQAGSANANPGSWPYGSMDAA
jgi:PAS domain S-box-containing protein